LRIACFGAFLIKIGLFLQIFVCGLLKFKAILLFQFTAKRNLGVFLCKFSHLGLFFGFASLLYLICLLVLCFFNFPTKRKLGLFFSVQLPILGLFFCQFCSLVFTK